MTGLSALLIPILVSAVLVFVVSSIIHMATPWHKNDHLPVPNQDAVMAALRPFNIPPGDYMLPRAGSLAEAKAPEFMARLKQGPVVVMTVLPPGEFAMGMQLAMWFVFSIVVSLFAGYVAGIGNAPGTGYGVIFRYVFTVAFAGYALALWPFSIWYKRSLGTTVRSTIDGAIYAAVTAGAFGWLWPEM